jgi:hypothetical protein
MRRLVLLAPVFVLASCGSHADAEGHGPQTTRSFPVGAFSSVELAGSDDVRVVRGPQASVTATGPSNVLDRLDIHVEGSQLKISRKSSGWHLGSISSRGAVITVTTPGIDAAALAGSGNLNVDRATGNAFKGSLAGSGNFRIGDVRVFNLTLELAGSGDLTAAGETQNAALNLGGSGNIAAANLVSQTAKIAVGGSGDVELAAKTSATISVAGSGNVKVKGTTNCQISKIGSGDVRCLP